MEHVIEKGIPIPETKKGKTKYEFLLSMEVGDSVLLNIKQSSIQSSISILRKRNPKFKSFKFTTRIVEGGIRVWRTE